MAVDASGVPQIVLGHPEHHNPNSEEKILKELRAMLQLKAVPLNDEEAQSAEETLYPVTDTKDGEGGIGKES